MNTKTAPEIIDATCSDSMCRDKDTYRMEVRCLNCGWAGEQRITCGHEPHVGRSIGAECPRCEVRALSSGAFVVREGAATPQHRGEATEGIARARGLAQALTDHRTDSGVRHVGQQILNALGGFAEHPAEPCPERSSE